MKELNILTLNLHTYQELQYEKLYNEDFFQRYNSIFHQRIANMIEREEIDVAFFQEVGQHRNNAILYAKHAPVKDFNAVDQISKLLPMKNDYVFDFSHYGWNDWEEGLAILSKTPLIYPSSFYVSKEQSRNSFLSRKILSAKTIIDDTTIFLCCVHLNWFNNGFSQEIDAVIKHIMMNYNKDTLVILAGDFNNAAHTEGYRYFIEQLQLFNLELNDSYFQAHPNKFNEPTIRGDSFNNKDRIDYIFIGGEKCKILSSELHFYDHDEYGRVSDHYGLVTKILFNN